MWERFITLQIADVLDVFAKVICKNARVGSGVVIVHGVHRGKNVVIGAGSIVTKDIPDNVVAVGNPCRVLRKVSEHDREYYYKSDKIDRNEID